MIRQGFKKILRVTAWVTLTLFSVNSVSWATDVSHLGSEMTSGQLSLGQEKNSSRIPLDVPGQFGTVEKTFEGRTSFPVIYIQDAHASLEAQENIAKLIDYFTEHQHIYTVYAEGFEGETPLDRLYPFPDPSLKKKVSYFFLDYLRLNGSEYAFVNRTRDFKLIGIESTPDYLENLKWYEKGAGYRKAIQEDLAKIEKELKPLGAKYFPPEFKEWQKLKTRLDHKQISLADYIFRSFKLFYGSQVSDAAYPHLSFIAKNLNAEGLSRSEQETYDFQLRQMNAKTLFRELDQFENDVARKCLRTEEARRTDHFQKGLALVSKLNQFSITPEELETLGSQYPDLTTLQMAQFIAAQRKKSVVLSDEWEEFIGRQKQFYAIASRREADFKKRLALDAPAILVTGGFHQHGMTDFLEARGVSYIVVTPKITKDDPEHQKRYDFLMSGNHYPFEKNLSSQTASIPPMTQPVQYVIGTQNLPAVINSIALSLGKLPSPSERERGVGEGISGASLGAKEALQKKIWDAFDTLKPGESREIGSVEELIYMPDGRLQWSFPIPGGKKLGKPWRFGAGLNLKSVTLAIVKEKEGSYRLVFRYTDNQGKAGETVVRWNGTEYEVIGSVLQWRVWTAFETLKIGESREIGPVEELIRMTTGQLQQTFPIPGGKQIGKERSFGALKNLKSVTLAIVKEKEGSYRLVFRYTDETGKSREAVVRWNGKEYEVVGSGLQWKIWDAFESLKPGESREIGPVEELIRMTHGQLQKTFPIPDGKQLGKNWSFGAGTNLKSVTLAIVKEEKGSYRLLFRYTDQEGKSREAVVRWNGKEYWTSQQVIQEKIWTAFDTMKPGESREIGSVEELIQMSGGRLQQTFPIPGGKKLGKQWSFGAGENLKSVNLTMKKDSTGPVYLELAYQSESGKSGISRITWDAASQSYVPYIPESARPNLWVLNEGEEGGEVSGASLGAKEALRKKIWDAFETLKPGESREMGPVEELIYMPHGQLQTTFPIPGGKQLGKSWSFGAGKNLKSVTLDIVKEKEGNYRLIFRYTDQEGMPGEATVRWNGKEYQTSQQVIQEKIWTAFETLKPGESREIGPVEDLIRMMSGRLQKTFPIPGGKQLGKHWSFGAVTNLKSVTLEIVKEEEGIYRLIFRYMDQEGKPGDAVVRWNGTEYEVIGSVLQWRIWTAFETLKPGESCEIGSVEELIQKTHGQLQRTFPIPGGKQLGKCWSFGAVENLRGVNLEMVKEDEGTYRLVFRYTDQEGKPGDAVVRWNGKEYEAIGSVLQWRIWTAFETLKPGESRKIGPVEELIGMTNGQLQWSFPIPGGRKIGKLWNFGAVRNLKSVNLTMKKDSTGPVYLELAYQAESGKSGISRITWDEASQSYVPYVPESARPNLWVLNEEGEEGGEVSGASLGAKEALQRKIWDAFETLKVGESREIGRVDELIYMSGGQLKITFPMPGMKKIGRHLSIGSGKDLKSVNLEIVKENESQFQLNFGYEKNTGEMGKSVIQWNGIEYVTEREEFQRIIWRAFSNLKEGQSIQIGRIDEFVEMKSGRLLQTFPAPGGGQLGKVLSLGTSKSLTSVNLEIVKQNREIYLLIFTHENNRGVKKKTVIQWDGSQYVRIGTPLQFKIWQAFDQLQPGQIIQIGPVDELISMNIGALREIFPAPGGKRIGELWSFGAGHKLKSINLEIKRENDGTFDLKFFYQKDKEGSGVAIVKWNGSAYLTSREDVQNRIWNALESLEKNSQVEIGSVEGVIYLKEGRLLQTFPIPGRKTLGKTSTFNASIKLRTINLILKRDADGPVYFEFSYQTESGKSGISRITWDEASQSYVPYTPESARPNLWVLNEGEEGGEVTGASLGAKEAIQKKIWDAFDTLKPGDSREIGTVEELLAMKYGQLQKSFPIPRGKQLGKNRGFGAVENLRSVALEIVKEEEGSYRLVFRYTDQEGKPGEAVVRWNGKEYEVVGSGLQWRMWQAFETLKPGESRKIGSVEELIQMTQGRLQNSFPIPGGKQLGKVWSFGAVFNLKSVNLEIMGEGKGIYYLIFRYTDSQGKVGDAVVQWNGTAYEVIGSVLQWRIRNAFDTLKPGESCEIGSVEELIQMSGGKLQRSFPIPGGGMVGKNWGFGARLNLKNVTLEMVKEEEGSYRLVFRYTDNQGNQGEAVVRWNGTEYEVIGSGLQWKIWTAFETLKPGESREIGSIEELVRMPSGQLQTTFPIPGGKQIGKPWGFGAVTNLKSVTLEMVKEEEGNYRLVFRYRGQEEKPGEAIVRWNGTEYEAIGSGLQWRIWDAFDTLKAGESREIGSVEELLAMKYGQLQWSFPIPGGKELGKRLSFGAVKDLKSVNLTMKQDSIGPVYLELAYQSESGKSGISRITWEEASQSYVPYTPESARPNLWVLNEEGEEKTLDSRLRGNDKPISGASLGEQKKEKGFQRAEKAPLSIEGYPMDGKLYGVEGYANSGAYLDKPDIVGVPKVKCDPKAKDSDVTVIIKNRKIHLIFLGHPKPGTDLKDYDIVYRSPESNQEDDEFMKEARQVLKEIFKEDILFFATRYNMDIRALLWGIIGQRLKGKYSRKKIEELINRAILSLIDKSISEETEEAKPVPIPKEGEEAKPEEAPKTFEEKGIQISDITSIADQLEHRIKQIKDEGLRAMMTNQAINFIRKLEENYFFKKFYHPDPKADLFEHIRSGILEAYEEVSRNDLAKQALSLIQDDVTNALILNEELHTRGLLDTETNLNLYQLVGVMRMLEKRKIVLADEMGLGKTLEAISTFLLSNEHEMVVVAPKLALNRWQEDLAKRTNTKIQLVILGGDKPIKALESNEKIQVTHITKPTERNAYLFGERAPPPETTRRIVLINYELMPTLYQYRKEKNLPAIKTPFLALDEAHLLKNRTSQTSKSIFGEEIKKKTEEEKQAEEVKASVEGAVEAKYKILMSGTPLENEIKELFSYLKYLALHAEGEAQTKGKDAEADAKAEKLITDLPVQNLIGTFRHTNLPNLSLLYNYLSQRMIRRLKNDVVTGLPVKKMKTAKLDPMTGEMKVIGEGKVLEQAKLPGNYLRQVSLYQQALSRPNDFEREMVQKLPPLEVDNEEELPDSAKKEGARQLLRLEQIALDPVIFGEEADSIKFDAAKKLIEERIKAGKSVVVFTNYKTVSSRFRKFLEKEFGAGKISYVDGSVTGADRQKEIDRFQYKDSQIMIATTGTMALAIELTQADSMMFLNYPWKPSLMNQAIDRAHRLDPKRNVPGKELEIISMEMEHKTSIDREKRKVLKRKEILQEMIVDGNLSPEILEAFIESDKKIMDSIEEGQAEEIKFDDHALSLLSQFRLLMGRIMFTGNPELWTEASELYATVLEHQASFFANQASLDYLSGEHFPELKSRRLDVLDLASGPSTLHRAYLKQQILFERRNFRLDITDYDASAGMLAHGVAKPGQQILGTFAQLDQFKKEGSAYDMINLSFALYEAAHPAQLIRNVYRLLKDRGVFALILMEGTVIPPQFYEAMQRSGFELKTGEGAKLQSELDDETYDKVRAEYGKEFADDLKHQVKRQFTYLVASKTHEPTGEVKDEDFALTHRGKTLLNVQKARKLFESSGKTTLIPAEITLEGQVINVEQYFKNEEEKEKKKEEAAAVVTATPAPEESPAAAKASRSYRGMRKLITDISTRAVQFASLEPKQDKKIAQITKMIERSMNELKERIAKKPKDLSAEERGHLAGELQALKERNYARQYFKDERLAELDQVIDSLKVTGASLGAKEELQKKIWDAFENLKPGESREIGSVDELIYMANGQLQITFPIPGRKQLGKQWNFGSGKNLKSVNLGIVKEGEERYRLIFRYIDHKGKPGEVMVRWDGEKYKAVGSSLQWKIWQAFDTLKIGESREIGSVDELIQMMRGQLLRTFPIPGGKQLGKQWSFGTGWNLESVNLAIVKVAEGIFRLIFRYTDDKGKTREAVVRWNGKEYQTSQQEIQEKIRDAFATLKSGESREIDSVEELIYMKNGLLLQTFPIPGGGKLGKNWSFGVGGNLKTIKLDIVKEEEKTYRLVFRYTDQEGKSGDAVVRWNGKEYEAIGSVLQWRIWQAFESLRAGESREIGSVEELIQMTNGQLQRTFPIPGGKQLVQKWSFGVGRNLKTVKLDIVKEEEGTYRLVFRYTDETGKSGDAVVKWNGKEYEAIGSVLQWRIWTAFESLKSGESWEIGSVEELVQMTNGQLRQIFPIPGGKQLGEHQNFGAGGNLKSVGLTMKRDVSGPVYLKFAYQGESGKSGISRITWDEASQSYVPYTPESARPNLWVLNEGEEGGTPVGGASLGAKEELVRRIQNVFTSIKPGEMIEIGDVSPLIQKSGGSLLGTFPIPGGGQLGKYQSFGALTHLKTVNLIIQSEKDYGLILRFDYENQKGDHANTLLRWNEANQKYEVLGSSLQWEILRAFKQLKEGESKNIGSVDELVQMSEGQLLRSFPVPSGGVLERQQNFGASRKLKAINLVIEKANKERTLLHFRYMVENGNTGEALVIWSEEQGKYLTMAEEKREKIRKAFKELKEGKLIEIGPVEELIEMSAGNLKQTFPVPGGGTLVAKKGLGEVKNLKNVNLVIEMQENGNIILRFNCIDKNGQSDERAMKWDKENNTYVRAEEEIQARIWKAFESLKGEEVIEIGDVSPLIRMDKSQLQRIFPIPGHKTFGQQKHFGAVGNLKTINLKIQKKDENNFLLTFQYVAVENRSGEATIFWDESRKTYLTGLEEMQERIWNAFDVLKEGEAKVMGSVERLINKSQGRLLQTFPIPGGGTIGKQQSLRSGIKLKAVNLTIRKESDGKYYLLFQLVNQFDVPGNVLLVWNEARNEYEIIGTELQWRIWHAFETLKAGESREIGPVIELIHTSSGQFGVSFPIPGREELRKVQNWGAAPNLKSANLVIEKETDNQFILKFQFMKENGKAGDSILLWDGVNREYKVIGSGLQWRIWHAFESLKDGEESRIGSVEELVQMTNGQLQITFPAPQRSKIGKFQPIGAFTHLKTINLLMKRNAGGQIYLEFSYQNQDGKSGISRITWDEASQSYVPYIPESTRPNLWVLNEGEESGEVSGASLGAKEALIQRIRDTFMSVNPGETIKIDDVRLLIDLRSARLKKSFPLPNGKNLGRYKSFGVVKHLDSVFLNIQKDKAGNLILEFNYSREGEKVKDIGKAVIFWNGAEFLTPEEKLTKEIQIAYETIKPGETREIGDVSLLVNLLHGLLQRTFPLPDGSLLGDKKGLGAAEKLTVVNLRIKKDIQGNLMLEFDYQHEKQKELKWKQTTLYWSAGELLTPEEKIVKEIRAAFETIQEGEAKNIGDISLMIYLPLGIFRTYFPLPNGEKIAKPKAIGTGQNLKAVNLIIRKDNGGNLILEFYYQKQGELAPERNPAIMYWENGEYVTPEENLERKIRSVYKNVGIRERLEIGNVSLFIKMTGGELKHSFPLPNGKVLGKYQSFGSGGNLKAVTLFISKDSSEKLILEFYYQKADESDFQMKSVRLMWNGKDLVPYTPESERPNLWVLNEGEETTPTEGASLGQALIINGSPLEMRSAMTQISTAPIPVTFDFEEWKRFNPDIQNEIFKHLLEKRIKILLTHVPAGTELPLEFRQISGLVHVASDGLSAEEVEKLQGFLGKNKIIHLSEHLKSTRVVTEHLNDVQIRNLIFVQPHDQQGVVSAALLFAEGISLYQKSFEQDASGFWIPTDFGRLLTGLSADFMKHQVLARAA